MLVNVTKMMLDSMCKYCLLYLNNVSHKNFANRKAYHLNNHRKIMQNLVIFIEPGQLRCDISLKGGKMCFNKFCIDEDDGFELSAVRYLKQFSMHFILDDETNLANREMKGKGKSRALIKV